MLIEFPSSETDALQQRLIDGRLLWDDIAEILRSHYSGRHAVFLPPRTGKMLKECATSEEVARLASIVMADANDVKAVSKHSMCILSADYYQQKPVRKAGNLSGIQYYHATIPYLASATSSCTVILGENRSDAIIYGRLGALRLQTIAQSKFRTFYNPFGGGGSTTHSTLDAFVDEDRLIYCVLDSDRRFPSASVSSTSTAGKALAINRHHDSAYQTHVLQGRTIENHFGLEEFAAALEWKGIRDRATSIRAEQKRGVIRRGRTDFLQLKEPFTIEKFRRQVEKGGKRAEYLHSIFGESPNLPICTAEACSKECGGCAVYDGIGIGTVKVLSEYIATESPNINLTHHMLAILAAEAMSWSLAPMRSNR